MSEELTIREDYTSEKRREERLAKMLEVEDELLQTSEQIIAACLAAQEIDPGQPEPPPAWITVYGEEAARKRMHFARAGHLPKKDMPVAVDLAYKYSIGTKKARGHRAQVQAGTLNVKIQLPAPTSAEHPAGEVYPEIEIE